MFAIIASSFVFILIYITWLANNPIHYDTFLYEAIPGTHYDSAQIGRWGLCLFKYLINGWIFNKFLEKILGYLTIILAMILFGYEGFCFSKKFEKIWPWFGLIIVSSPLMCNMLYFEMMLIGTGMGFLLTALSIFFNFLFIHKNKLRYCIIGIICGTIAFGCYQAFINIYISFALLIFILKHFDEKWNIKEIVTLIFQFLIMFITNFVIGKLTGETADYGYNTITWGQIPFFQSLYAVIRSTGKILLAPPNCFTIIFSIFLLITIIFATILLIKKILNNKYYFILVWIAIGIFELSAFFIIIVKGGGNIPPRGLIAYTYVLAGNILLIYNILSNFHIKYLKESVLVIMLTVVLFANISITAKMLYNDYVRNTKDVQVLNEINTDLHKFDNKSVAFIGYCDPDLNGLITEAFETIDISILNEKKLNQITDYSSHTNHLTNIFHASSINMKIHSANESQIQEATQTAKNMATYPNNGYIKDCGSYLIVKLGEVQN